MNEIFNKFWKWYERHKTFNLGLAAFLFTLQIVHWLTGDVVVFRLTGSQLFGLHGHDNFTFFEVLILLVDYLEIPAIFTTSLVYLNELRNKFSYRSLLYLFFINSQWLHIFWITDEFVVETFTGSGAGTILPFWLAWVAILIDYLELPVIYDTLNKFFRALKEEGILRALEELEG